MAIRKFLTTALVTALLPATSAVHSEMHGNDWPQFRGQDRDGISHETGLVDDWGDDGPPEVWRVEIGEGYSGIAVVGDRLYTMYADASIQDDDSDSDSDSDDAEDSDSDSDSAESDDAEDSDSDTDSAEGDDAEDSDSDSDSAESDDAEDSDSDSDSAESDDAEDSDSDSDSAEGDDAEDSDSDSDTGEAAAPTMEYAAAFDATTGEEIWRTPIGEKLDTEFGNGPRSTPTVDGDSVYVLGSHGDLAALDAATGEKRWYVSLTETFGSQRPYWGFSASALIDGDRLIIEGGGGDGKSYAALDKNTGEIVWTSGDGRPGHNSPIQIEMMGETHYVYVAGNKLRAIDSEGNEVWAHEWPPGETHASPIFIPPNMVYASGAEGVGAQLLRIKEGAEGAELEEVWKEPRLRNHFATSVVHDGHIYGFDNATLKAVDVENGEMAWGKRGLGKGSLIYADGDLLVLSDRGELVLVEASGEEYVEKARIQALEGRSWTSPTLSNGRLYLRNHSEMVAYDLTTDGS